jgi:DNA-binding Lrp family transcriptional regulator
MIEAFLIIRAKRIEDSNLITEYMNELKNHNSPRVEEVYNTNWDVIAKVSYESYSEFKEFLSKLRELGYVENVTSLAII